MDGIDLSLERLKKYSFPTLPPTIHVAGTNGKGSTLAFMKAALEKAGYCVHRYTSPYLWDVTECIELCGVPVEKDSLQRTLQNFENTDLTPFEKLTMAAFSLFSQTPADFLLLETGLGGRLDATNIIERPVVTAITSIGYDHQEFLGKTLAKIAYEKAGIIKPFVPCCLSACIPQEAVDVIEKIAKERQAPLIFSSPYEGALSLYGDHQRFNAGVAFSCLSDVLGLSLKVIQEGFQKAKWPGRLQKIHYGNQEVWIDGAHNAEGIQALLKSLPGKQPWHAIVGIKNTKDYKAILKLLSQRIASFSFIPIPEGHDPSLLKDFCPGESAVNLENALSHRPKNAEVLVTGSLTLCSLFDKKMF